MMLAGLGLGLGLSGRVVNDVRSVASVVYSGLAVLIIARHPQHMVGWLFVMVGFFSALAELVSGLAQLAPYLRSGLMVGLIAWVGHLVWIPAFMIPITLVLLFFPDGRLPSRRWWPIAAATLAGIAGYAASLGFHPWPWEGQAIADPYNPFGIAGSERFFDGLSVVSLIFFGIGGIGCLAAVVVRFRRSQGIERIQMKWLVYAAVGGVPPLFLFLGNYENPIFRTLFLSLPTLFAGAIGLAILRHRLFDIDLIIRRTLLYGVLTALLAVVYFGSVIVLEGLLRGVTGGGSPLVIVLSTLIIAALFGPLRARVQRVIDRRFYRRKYDAARTLAAFGASARDETDLERLRERLLAVVDETMQPEQAGLWLAAREKGQTQ